MDRVSLRAALRELSASPAGPDYLRFSMDAVQAKVGDDGIEALCSLGAVKRILEYQSRGLRPRRIMKPPPRRVHVLDVPRDVLRVDP